MSTRPMYAFLVVLQHHHIICRALIIKMGARQNSKWIMSFSTNSHCHAQPSQYSSTSLWNNEVQSTVKLHSEHVCMYFIIKTKANSQVCSKKYVLYPWQIMYVIKSSCFRERNIITFFSLHDRFWVQFSSHSSIDEVQLICTLGVLQDLLFYIF